MNFGGTQLAHNNIYFLYFKGYSIKLQKREHCPTLFINVHLIPKLDNKNKRPSNYLPVSSTRAMK